MGILGRLIKQVFKKEINGVKGKVGEMRVSSKLNPLIFGRVEHRQIDGLILVDKNGRSHQIDHVEIRENGIFCIETKNYAGRILGNAEDRSWTQLVGRQKNTLGNPVRQNNSHVYHVKEALGGKYRVNSVVVMVKNNAPRGIPGVVNLSELGRYLADYDDGTHYTVDEMDRIYSTLLAHSRTDITKREHLGSIKRTEADIKNKICPRCGGKLVLRHGQYGEFYGCSGYPGCRFKMKKED